MEDVVINRFVFTLVSTSWVWVVKVFNNNALLYTIALYLLR